MTLRYIRWSRNVCADMPGVIYQNRDSFKSCLTEKFSDWGTMKCQGVNHRCFLLRATVGAAKLRLLRLLGEEAEV